MDKIASIEKLQQGLGAIGIADDYTQVQDLITELHFAYEEFRFKQDLPSLTDQGVLWNVAYYLITALSYSGRQNRLPSSVVEDGLAISGLVFELIGRYSKARQDGETSRVCNLNASIAYTLSRYQANSSVLAKLQFDEGLLPSSPDHFIAQCDELGMNLVFGLLGRQFFWLSQNKASFLSAIQGIGPEHNVFEEVSFWAYLCQAGGNFADFMLSGEEAAIAACYENINRARDLALHYEMLTEHWLASRLLNCVVRMEQRSSWRVLRRQDFSPEYISILTRFPWNSVHELWDSQIEALEGVDLQDGSKGNILSDNIKRVLVTMPTSAGKTLIAEMLIVRALERYPNAKCIYVAPSRALVDEVESKLHYRLRFLGYKVASVVGSFEISEFEEVYLEKINVAILTPEKLDYLFRKRDPFVNNVSLIIFDETHKVGEGERGWLLETLITWLLLKPNIVNTKMVFMSAVIASSQHTDIRLWLGQGNASPVLSSNWSPTRQLIGVLNQEVDWSEPLVRKPNGDETYWETSNLLIGYRIGSEPRSIENIFRFPFVFNRPNRKVTKHSTRYDKSLALVSALGSDNSILVYFQRKSELIAFCNQAPKFLPKIDDPGIIKLIDYIEKRLGKNFPLCKSLPFGVGFHHGDLPPDIRSEIEIAYRNKIIPVLACTTTLAEGVNLPIKTFILGYPQTPYRHRISVRDFKNIIGRAGRALVDTEGLVIAIRHPEFNYADKYGDKDYFDDLIQMPDEKLLIASEFLGDDNEEDVIEELRILQNAITDATSLFEHDVDELAEQIHRLQIFVFTLLEDGIIKYPEEDPDTIRSILSQTLLFRLKPSKQIEDAVTQLCVQFVAVSSQLEQNRLRRFNASGLGFRSNVILEQITQQILKRTADFSADDYRFENILTSADLQAIMLNIREAKPKQSEYSGKYFEVVSSLDHYAILIDWVRGSDFSTICDKYFRGLENIEERTELCQSYMSKQFSYKLPWISASLYVHSEQLGSPLLKFWLNTIPAQIKYGVDTPEAVYFCTVGIRSRFLARRLGEIYRQEVGAMVQEDWDPVENWFLRLSPFSLRERAPDLPELAVRQAIRRVNTIRRPSRRLFSDRRIYVLIAGWQYYEGEKLIDEIFTQYTDTVLELKHEPENEYDEYAVAIYWPRVHAKLGYIPREHNEEVATLLALGHRLETRIVTIRGLDAGGRRQVEIRVEMLE